MTERKFTDEDVIKALECCTSAECDKCKWEPRGDCYRGSVECNDDLMRYALDLVNRQRAEIERLRKQGASARSIEELCAELESRLPETGITDYNTYLSVLQLTRKIVGPFVDHSGAQTAAINLAGSQGSK